MIPYYTNRRISRRRQVEEALDNYCDFLANLASNLENIPVESPKDNLTCFERDLVHACKIVIMPTYKGGAVVILEADHYKRMVEDLFLDPQYFEESYGNQMKATINKISALCRKYSEKLTKEKISYHTRFDYKEANFMACLRSIKVKSSNKQPRSKIWSLSTFLVRATSRFAQ